MFNKFYTTQMSGSAKMLQKRFTEIRRRRGRAARLAAAVMSAVMAVSMLAATAAMAAIGADGLEYWDRDEIYFKNSVSFPINVTGKNVPSWVYEDVAGGDGNIVVTVSEYQVRYSDTGHLCEEAVIELSGAKDTTRLPGCTWATTSLIKENFPYPFRAVMAFTEADKSMRDILKTDDAGLIDKDSGKQKYVIIDLGVNESYKIEKITGITFCDDIGKDSPFTPIWSYDMIEVAPEAISYNGGFEKNAFTYDGWNGMFTVYESDYQNHAAYGISINLAAADRNGLTLRTNITNPKAAYAEAVICSDFRNLYPLAQAKMKLSGNNVILFDNDDANEMLPETGGRYRVCVGVYDSAKRLIYRWHEYVTFE